LKVFGGYVSKYEEPKYKVLQSHHNFEVRQYGPKIVAETIVSGKRNRAINDGFSILADYIFGNNTPNARIAMTTPVLRSQQREKIAMTAPVLQTANRTAWTVQFIMPSQYTLATLPQPNNPSITIKEVPSSSIGAIRFSGSAETETLRKKEVELRTYLNNLGN
jgi:hypothetical protein